MPSNGNSLFDRMQIIVMPPDETLDRVETRRGNSFRYSPSPSPSIEKDYLLLLIVEIDFLFDSYSSELPSNGNSLFDRMQIIVMPPDETLDRVETRRGNSFRYSPSPSPSIEKDYLLLLIVEIDFLFDSYSSELPSNGNSLFDRMQIIVMPPDETLDRVETRRGNSFRYSPVLNKTLCFS